MLLWLNKNIFQNNFSSSVQHRPPVWNREYRLAFKLAIKDSNFLIIRDEKEQTEDRYLMTSLTKVAAAAQQDVVKTAIVL